MDSFTSHVSFWSLSGINCLGVMCWKQVRWIKFKPSSFFFCFSSRMKMITEPMRARNPKWKTRIQQATSHPATESTSPNVLQAYYRVISYWVLSKVLRMLLLAGICQINVYTFIYQIVGAFVIVTRDRKHWRFRHFFLCFFSGVGVKIG